MGCASADGFVPLCFSCANEPHGSAASTAADAVPSWLRARLCGATAAGLELVSDITRLSPHCWATPSGLGGGSVRRPGNQQASECARGDAWPRSELSPETRPDAWSTGGADGPRGGPVSRGVSGTSSGLRAEGVAAPARALEGELAFSLAGTFRDTLLLSLFLSTFIHFFYYLPSYFSVTPGVRHHFTA